MHKTSFALSSLLVVGISLSAADHTIHTWRKIHMDAFFWSEGATTGDFNKDGKGDIASGPFWYQGPDFTTRHEIYAPRKTSVIKKAEGDAVIPGFKGALTKENDYSDNFLAFTHDFNADGWDDVMVYGFPGKEAFWFENPKGAAGHWKRHKALDVVDNESPHFSDITGDGKPDIVCNSGGYFGYATADWSDATKPWKWHAITPKGKWQRFTHGMGVGDVNGDGRMDLLEKDGWWEQPKSLDGDPEWRKHNASFGTGGAQMFAYDVNGDGRNDVISSLAAHGWGLAWYEQLEEKDDTGSPKFRQHTFMNKEPKENKYGVKFSQLHAIELADMDGDGLKDIVTGKRYWAHGPTGDAEPNAAAVLHWFRLVRGSDHSVDWVPYRIDDDSGVGTQVMVADVNGDKLLDVVVGNKKGTFTHLHSVKSVTPEQWQAAQPKPFTPPPAQ